MNKIPRKIAIITLLFAGALVSDIDVRIRIVDTAIQKGNIIERLLAVSRSVDIEVSLVRPVAASVHEYD